MATEPKLEQYLSRLDKALEKISVSDRADIITEIKSHILEAEERDPNREIDKLLASMGEPESVASRYLLERGLKLAKPSKAPVVKWLTIGFLGTFGMILVAALALIWRFTPLIQVDEESGQVSIAGGLITVKDKEGIDLFDDSYQGPSKILEGHTSIDTAKINRIQISFENGSIETSTSPIKNELKWKCKIRDKQDTASFREENQVFEINLKETDSADCNIFLPHEITTNVEGENGKINVIHPDASVEVSLENGIVSITPDPQKYYRYDTKVENGYVRNLDSSTAPNAIPIKISVENGTIQNTTNYKRGVLTLSKP